jgi:DNA adenine methylase
MSQHRTPLRYPGGKQKLTPFVIEILKENDLIDGHYVEPYAGGAGVAIELLLSNKVSHIHLNDSSFPIYAFWKSIISSSEQMCHLISRASLTIEEWKRQREIVRNADKYDELEVGFATFYLNRCNRSGVLSGGVIGGLEQKGVWKMDARFSRNELIRRIELISSRRSSISISNMDAEKYILNYIPNLPNNTFTYCDPPYFEKSSGLYLNLYKVDDHARIAGIIQDSLPYKWAVSYDGAFEILNYYRNRRMFLYDLQYNAARVYKGQEVFIFSDGLKIPSKCSLPYINDAIQRYSEMLY